MNRKIVIAASALGVLALASTGIAVNAATLSNLGSSNIGDAPSLITPTPESNDDFGVTEDDSIEHEDHTGINGETDDQGEDAQGDDDSQGDNSQGSSSGSDNGEDESDDNGEDESDDSGDDSSDDSGDDSSDDSGDDSSDDSSDDEVDD